MREEKPDQVMAHIEDLHRDESSLFKTHPYAIVLICALAIIAFFSTLTAVSLYRTKQQRTQARQSCDAENVSRRVLKDFLSAAEDFTVESIPDDHAGKVRKDQVHDFYTQMRLRLHPVKCPKTGLRP